MAPAGVSGTMAGEPRTEDGREGRNDREWSGERRDGPGRSEEVVRRPDEILGVLADDEYLDLLRMMVEEERPLSAREVADETGEPPTSVYRRHQAMADTPLVKRRTEVDTDVLA